MMRTTSDSQNPAPETSSADVWDDAGEIARDSNGSATILPPRKPPQESAASVLTGDNQEGLRIGSAAQFRQTNQAESQLDVREIDGSVVRLDPEEPTQPKMPRQVVFHEQVQEQPQEIEHKEWGRTRKISTRWMVGIGMGIVIVVLLPLALLPLVNRSNASNSRPGQTILAIEEEKVIHGGAVIEDLLARQPEADRIFGSFVSAATPDDVIRLVRDPDAVAPLIRAAHRPESRSSQWTPEKETRWNVYLVDGKPFGFLQGTLADFSGFKAYFVMTDGQLQLDWKATTGYGTATFDELEKNQGNPAEIRATVSPAGYYSPVFPENEFRSFQLIAPDNVKTIWGYTRRGEPVDDSLLRLLQGGDILKPASESKNVTLRLEHGPEGAFPNQWLIREMLHEEWISP